MLSFSGQLTLDGVDLKLPEPPPALGVAVSPVDPAVIFKDVPPKGP